MFNIGFKDNILINYRDKKIYLNNFNKKMENKNKELFKQNIDIQNKDMIRYIITDDLTKDKEELIVCNNKIYLQNNLNNVLEYLSNKRGNIVGTLKNWYDTDNIIPKFYKNNDNYVIDPNTRDIAFEIELFKEHNDICSLPQSIYREYRLVSGHYLQPSNEIETIF